MVVLICECMQRCVSEIIHATHLFHQCCKQVLFLVVSLLIDVAEVALVFLLWVDEGLDGIVACLHAELDTFVQNGLRVIRRVHISLGQRQNELLVMIDCSIDDSISDSFSDHLFSLLNTFQSKLGLDISH